MVIDKLNLLKQKSADSLRFKNALFNCL